MPHRFKAAVFVIGLCLPVFGCCTPRSSGGTTAAAPQPVTAAPQPVPAAPKPVKPAEPPKTKESCASCNGLWAVHGLADVASCNCRMKDAGKACRDGSDCQGACLADEARFEVVQAGPPPKGFYSGKCSEFETAFGCFKFIPPGIRAKGPQLQDEAADAMCID